MMFVGKCVVAYLPLIREKEYYIACACEEIYAPPSAYVHLFGFTVQGTFLRGMLILPFLASQDTKMRLLNENFFFFTFS